VLCRAFYGLRCDESRPRWMRERAGALNSELGRVARTGSFGAAGRTVRPRERSRCSSAQNPPVLLLQKHLAALPCKYSRRATACKQIVQKQQQIRNSNRACNDSHH
jgi:hypothetical protein